MVVLTLAQAAFALADTFAVALVARVFVGLGDAMTFVCVLRLVTTWFPSRRIPLVTQLTGVLGQLGALVAAVPMTWALRELGWTPTYLAAASLGLVLLVVLLVVVHDEPGSPRVLGAPLSWTTVRSSLAASWRHPGTRLVLAWAITRDPWHRSTIVLGIVGSIVAVWTVVLAWPGTAPSWLLVLLVVVVGVGGPASMVGFDLGRSFNPPDRLGAATGIINQGGFVASLLLVVAIGLVLDWRTPGASTDYAPGAFRWAMSVQYVLWAVGLTQIWRYRRRTRAQLLAEDPDAREHWRGRLA